MSDQPEPRGLNSNFARDLGKQGGKLFPLLERVQQDTSLDLEIRAEFLDVYYRGGRLLHVTKKGTGYTAFFDLKYADVHLELSTSDTETTAWLKHIPEMKDAMDLWFGKHRKAERASQQLVVYENNVAP